MEPSRARTALPRGGHGPAVPSDLDHARLRSHGGRGLEGHHLPVYGRDTPRRARPLSRRVAHPRASRRPLRQLPDRWLPAHGRGPRPGRLDGAGHGRGDRVRRRDPTASRSHGDPVVRRRCPRPRPVRLLSARVLRPLRLRARPLRRLRRRDQGAWLGRRRELPGPVRVRAGQSRGVPRPVRHGRPRLGARARARAGPMTAGDLSTNEMLAVLGSRALVDGQTVFTGVGAPMLATALAQRRHAPRLTRVVEGGIVGPQWRPGSLPISTNEIRAAYRAQMLPAITDIFLMAQRGFLDVGFIGGAQIDRFGNLNTSAIGGYARPKVRLPGSGGANDIISLCSEVIILTAHEPRRFVDQVDFITSPGYLQGGDSRRRSGLVFGGVSRLVTTLGIFDFEPGSRRMRLESVLAGVTVEEVRDQTPFDLVLAERVGTTPRPTDDELTELRALDPERQFLGAPERTS